MGISSLVALLAYSICCVEVLCQTSTEQILDSNALLQQVEDLEKSLLREWLLKNRDDLQSKENAEFLDDKSPKEERTSRRNDLSSTTHYTEAIVETDAEGRNDTTGNQLRLSGKFGHHSPHLFVRGRLVHVNDMGHSDSHYGCTGEIENGKELAKSSEPWIALISRGKCRFLVKIKLAEKYNARAAIIYDSTENNDVTVMQTIGTSIASLMIDHASGMKLADLIGTGAPIFANISVGNLNVQTSNTRPVTRAPQVKAIVNFLSKQVGSSSEITKSIQGKFAFNSPLKSVSGTPIHIEDFHSKNTHFGCTGRIANEGFGNIPRGEWIALVEQGECPGMVKIKLAEKYGASAVIIYSTRSSKDDSTLNAYGAVIPTIMLNVKEGREVLHIASKRQDDLLMIRVTLNRPSSGVTSQTYNPTGGSNKVLLSLSLIISSVVFSLSFLS